jgi:hypothetical protein
LREKRKRRWRNNRRKKERIKDGGRANLGDGGGEKE